MPHGAVLGRVTSKQGLVLSPEVITFRAYLDSGYITVVCPACGRERAFRGRALLSSTPRSRAVAERPNLRSCDGSTYQD